MLLEEGARCGDRVSVKLQPVILVHKVPDVILLDALGLQFEQGVKDLCGDGIDFALGKKNFAKTWLDILNLHRGGIDTDLAGEHRKQLEG